MSSTHPTFESWVPHTPPSQSQSSSPALCTCTGGRYNGDFAFCCRLHTIFTCDHTT